MDHSAFLSNAAQVIARMLQGPQANGSQPIYENMRNLPQYAQDQMAQNVLGPLAHQQFVQSATAQNPLVGLGVLAGTPVYSAWKAIDPTTAAYFGRTSAWDNTKMSQPSWEEIGRAAQGFRSGLGDYLQQLTSGGQK